MLMHLQKLCPHNVLTVLNGGFTDSLVEKPLPQLLRGERHVLGGRRHEFRIGYSGKHVLHRLQCVYPRRSVFSTLRPQMQPLLRPGVYRESPLVRFTLPN